MEQGRWDRSVTWDVIAGVRSVDYLISENRWEMTMIFEFEGFGTSNIHSE